MKFKADQEQNIYQNYGRICQVVGAIVKGYGDASIGDVCLIKDGKTCVQSEVIGFEGEQLILAPFGRLDGISNRSAIIPTHKPFQIQVGQSLLGRMLDGMGQIADDLGEAHGLADYNSKNDPPNPASRIIIDQPIQTGIKAIDSMISCGIGQRMGIFAAAGGGKSTLMGMMIRNAKVDIVIIALIGERGREVNEFLEFSLGPEGVKKSIIVVATSDRPAIEQIQAAYSATAMAEYFRDLGFHVLLFMDSVTRFARAQRQIGLAAGEPPTRRGFPPSVFEKLPILLERPGRLKQGAITAFYTVLVEGDDMTEPVADEVRSLLDGHIILSRKLAQKGHYPAIDVLSSASRILSQVVDKAQQKDILEIKKLMAKYDDIELILSIGEYQKGSDPLADQAIEKKPLIDALLQQMTDENIATEESLNLMKKIVS